MNKPVRLAIIFLLLGSLATNAVLAALARWNSERITMLTASMELMVAAEQLKSGEDKLVVLKLIGHLPHNKRETDRGTTVFGWIPDQHMPFLHRIRFGGDASNGSYYLYIEFDANDKVVEVSSGNF